MIHIFSRCLLMIVFVCADEVFQTGQEGAESMTSQQVTLWLQALFVFAVVWSLGGTINGNSRKKFDVFYRNLIMGTNTDHPRPQSVKLTKSNVFPERGLTFNDRVSCKSVNIGRLWFLWPIKYVTIFSWFPIFQSLWIIHFLLDSKRGCFYA